MLRKIVFLTTMTAILVGIGLLSPGGTGQAHAQEEALPEDSTCKNCHEDRYYLHDSGKWYCLNETKVSCTECHRGRADTMIADSAHAGLIPNPLVDDAAVCQDCHPDDYRARAQIYASIVGASSSPQPYATYTPSALVSQPGESAGGTRLLRALPPGAWQATGFSFLGVAFLVLFLSACRCWKADRSAIPHSCMDPYLYKEGE